MKSKTSGDALTFTLLLLWPILLILLLLLGMWTWGGLQKPLIRHRVMEYAPALEDMGQQALELAASGEELPAWAEDKKVRVDAEDGLVLWETFTCGLVPSGRGYGCYYAADSEPHESRWYEVSRSEHITGNIYYYEYSW